jgi:Sec-independent protein translocase protein TatA
LALFESIGTFELVLVGLAALLLFGKDLPRVAAEAGAQFTKLRRSLDSTWKESGLEREVRQIRDAIPRDLSLGDVARTASEKLSVRLDEEDRARRAADPASGGPIARGALDPDAPTTAPEAPPATEAGGSAKLPDPPPVAP